jgi:hypothetical protein
MSVVSPEMRVAVVKRADERCEYCHLPTRGQVATFPIDHVNPRSNEGTTTLENLALACPRCNGSKWKHTNWADPLSGNSTLLFNPRSDSWIDHFRWSTEWKGILEGLTDIGRATIACLQINHPEMIALRQLLAALGLFEEFNS